jgi:hypothetical protein
VSARIVYAVATGEIRICSTGDVTAGEGEAVLDVPDMIRPSGYRVDLDTLSLVAAPVVPPDPLVALRRVRDAWLASSDWTRLNDAPISAAQRAEAAVFRQALRAAPQSGVLPARPEWLKNSRAGG